MKIFGRTISFKNSRGELMISKKPISFLGMVNPHNGMIIDKSHDLYGKIIKNKILLFPYGCGSTVGSYVLYQLKKNNVAPKGIINLECESIIAIGSIMANIPLIDKLQINPYSILCDGYIVTIDGKNQLIEFDENII